MGFLSALFGRSKSRSRSKPAKPTPEQLALQKQAVRTGEIQVGNLERQTDFQTGLFDQLMQRLNQQQTVQSNLFGSPGPPGGDPREAQRSQFQQKQQRDLAAFKRQLGGGGLSRSNPGLRL